MYNVNARSAKLHNQPKPGTKNFGIPVRIAPTESTVDSVGFDGMKAFLTCILNTITLPERHLGPTSMLNSSNPSVMGLARISPCPVG